MVRVLSGVGGLSGWASGDSGRGGAGGEVGIDGGEGGEVVGAADVVGGVLEDGEVEGPGAVPYVGCEHGGAYAVVGVGDGGRVDDAREDAVLVGLAEGAVAGVEVVGCWVDGEDADAGRKGAVECAMEVFGRDGDREHEGGYLGEGVDAGVGAA